MTKTATNENGVRGDGNACQWCFSLRTPRGASYPELPPFSGVGARGVSWHLTAFAALASAAVADEASTAGAAGGACVGAVPDSIRPALPPLDEEAAGGFDVLDARRSGCAFTTYSAYQTRELCEAVNIP